MGVTAISCHYFHWNRSTMRLSRSHKSDDVAATQISSELNKRLKCVATFNTNFHLSASADFAVVEWKRYCENYKWKKMIFHSLNWIYFLCNPFMTERRLCSSRWKIVIQFLLCFHQVVMNVIRAWLILEWKLKNCHLLLLLCLKENFLWKTLKTFNDTPLC